MVFFVTETTAFDLVPSDSVVVVTTDRQLALAKKNVVYSWTAAQQDIKNVVEKLLTNGDRPQQAHFSEIIQKYNRISPHSHHKYICNLAFHQSRKIIVNDNASSLPVPPSICVQHGYGRN
jgi:hypothetical protein